MTKVALLVVYNHRYDRNIPCIQDLYKTRFSNIFHVVPFYDGDIANAKVIPVYENSYRFQGYVSQAYTHLKGKGFTHYFVIADDMILNPSINEHNIWEMLQVDEDACFIPAKPIILQKSRFCWQHTYKAMQYNVNMKGVEIQNILPSKQEAEQLFIAHNFPVGPVAWRAILDANPISWAKMLVKIPWHRNLTYPLLGCYSDIFMVTQQAMDKFCTYCGAFAATGLFVEIAIPTALVLSADKLKFEYDLALADGSMWECTDNRWIGELNYSLDALYKHFPKDKLFVHPIKLSKWR